jgi:hypothetical protein
MNWKNLQNLKEIICNKVLGGHILKGIKPIGLNPVTGHTEYSLHCIRCNKLSMVDWPTLSKAKLGDELDGSKRED